jgi:hypothetical protein
LYAYRQYYDDNKNVIAILQQPSYFSGTVVNNTVKTGLDYSPERQRHGPCQLAGYGRREHRLLGSDQDHVGE